MKYSSEHEMLKCIEDESHRKAFQNRVNFVEVNIEHLGDKSFPYDSFDLAYYLLDLCIQNDIANGLAPETVYSSEQSINESNGDMRNMQRDLVQLNQNLANQIVEDP